MKQQFETLVEPTRASIKNHGEAFWFLGYDGPHVLDPSRMTVRSLPAGPGPHGPRYVYDGIALDSNKVIHLT